MLKNGKHLKPMLHKPAKKTKETNSQLEITVDMLTSPKDSDNQPVIVNVHIPNKKDTYIDRIQQRSTFN